MNAEFAVRRAWLDSYRRSDVIAVNPYTFEAGKGPGVETVESILAIAKASNCLLDPGASGTPLYLRGLPKDDDDLEALLDMCQIKPELP